MPDWKRKQEFYPLLFVASLFQEISNRVGFRFIESRVVVRKQLFGGLNPGGIWWTDPLLNKAPGQPNPLISPLRRRLMAESVLDHQAVADARHDVLPNADKVGIPTDYYHGIRPTVPLWG